MPNQIGQAYGLTVLSPIKAGHVDDALAYVQAIERSGNSPFSRIGGDRPTVHTARWVVLDKLAQEGSKFHAEELKSRYLLFDANLDTDVRGLDGFLDDMVKAMPDEIAGLYQHCEGFTGKNFAEYIKRCQIETTFYFVDYAADERGKVVHVREAMKIKSDFVALTASTQTQDAPQARRGIEQFLERMEWTPSAVPVVTHNTTSPARTLQSQNIELDDVQGNVLRGYNFPFARHLYFRVVDVERAKASLVTLAENVDSSRPWTTKPPSTFNLAFSYAGLEALGVPDYTLSGFPIAFRMGMRSRAQVLGDDGTSAPDSWESVWKDGIHVLASLYANDEVTLQEETQWVCDTFKGATQVGSQDAAKLQRDGKVINEEHFGYVDGLGTTDIQSPGLDNTPGSGKRDANGQWIGLAPGELLYGYFDEANELPEAASPPDFAKNGTFLVYRKLEENVYAFRQYLATHAKDYGDEELLAAKIVGRFRDGTPLALADKPNPKFASSNDFLYADDPDGAKCPITSHIRRSRPRDSLGFNGKLTDRRRLQRRGMPYGPMLPTDAKDDGPVERGILFMAYNIDIERQFEFIQQHWLNYGNAFRQSNDKDILSGNHDGTGKAVIQASGGKPPYLCTSLPRFVNTRGGEYFFVPGLAALRAIAEGLR